MKKRTVERGLSSVAVLCVMMASLLSPPLLGDELPGRYFRLLEAGSALVETKLNAEPGAGLTAIESTPEWRHFPYAILAPAVLYTKEHALNRRYGDPKMRDLVPTCINPSTFWVRMGIPRPSSIRRARPVGCTLRRNRRSLQFGIMN